MANPAIAAGEFGAILFRQVPGRNKKISLDPL
jgi:hypothetical protein